jgi:hypothetical protein
MTYKGDKTYRKVMHRMEMGGGFDPNTPMDLRHTLAQSLVIFFDRLREINLDTRDTPMLPPKPEKPELPLRYEMAIARAVFAAAREGVPHGEWCGTRGGQKCNCHLRSGPDLRKVVLAAIKKHTDENNKPDGSG